MGGFRIHNLLTVVDSRIGECVCISKYVDVLLTVGREGGFKAKVFRFNCYK